MFRYLLLGGALFGAVYLIGSQMAPTQPTPASQVITGITSVIKSVTSSKAAPDTSASTSSTVPAQNSGAASSAVTPLVDANAAVPYGTPSTSDGDAAISDAMGVAGARAQQVMPSTIQTVKQAVMAGAAALVGTPMAYRGTTALTPTTPLTRLAR